VATARSTPPRLDAPLVDSHCHLDDPRFDADREEVLVRARQAGVRALLVAGVDEERWRRAAGLFCGNKEIPVALSAGLHPWVAGRAAAGNLAELPAWLGAAALDPRCCALGETGLDASRACQPEQRLRQEEAFRHHLALARASGLPLVLHVVRAHARVLALLRSAGALPGGVVHSFCGSREEARAYLALGFHLGIGTALTRPDAGRLPAVVAACPGDRLLLETDAPDRPVATAAGGRGEPADLPWVVQAVALVRGESPEQVGEASARTAAALFGRAGWALE